ncbi:MAG: arginyl-transferase family protein, partial [Rhizomicrobium sp.]
VTEHQNTRVPQFFLTPGGPCPYLPGRVERKVFARLSGTYAQPLSEALTHSGFRRSQSIAYRPACDGCAACVSVRILVGQFEPSRTFKRVARRNDDLVRSEVVAEATREQFALLRTYLDSRHAGGGMSDMGLFDYVAMVEETPVDTQIVEYRRPGEGGRPGALVACGPDRRAARRRVDGLQLLPSRRGCPQPRHPYDPRPHPRRQKPRPAHVYLGYWVEGSEKMAYKTRFRPMEALGREGWQRLPEQDRKA